MRSTTPLIVPLAALAVLGVAACGDDDTATPTTTTEAALVEGVEVEILGLDNSFSPDTVEIEAGTVVRFVNNGRNDHNVIPEDETAEWLVPTEDFAPGAEATHRFTEPGTYRYFCSIHGTVDVGMVGSITVVEPQGDS